MSAEPSGARRVTEAARTTAAALAELQDARTGPDTPLAAYPHPLAQLGAAISQLSDGLFRMARLAADAMTPQAGQPETDTALNARTSLTAASRRTATASDHLGHAARAIRRDLIEEGISGADTARTRLPRLAETAIDQAALLDRALQLTRVPATREPLLLARLGQATRDQARALMHAAAACGKLHDAITAAYGPSAAKASHATAPLSQAARILQRAAAEVIDAADDIGQAYASMQKQAGS